MMARDNAAGHSNYGGKGNEAFGQPMVLNYRAGYQPPSIAGEGEEPEIAECGDE